MDTLASLEAVIGGIYIALLAALSPERQELANDLLLSFAGNFRLSNYERTLYADLAESAEMAIAPRIFDELAVHATASVH